MASSGIEVPKRFISESSVLPLQVLELISEPLRGRRKCRTVIVESGVSQGPFSYDTLSPTSPCKEDNPTASCSHGGRGERGAGSGERPSMTVGTAESMTVGSALGPLLLQHSPPYKSLQARTSFSHGGSGERG